MLEFGIPRKGKKAIGITTLDLRQENFGFFRDLLVRVPWDMDLE